MHEGRTEGEGQKKIYVKKREEQRKICRNRGGKRKEFTQKREKKSREKTKKDLRKKTTSSTASSTLLVQLSLSLGLCFSHKNQTPCFSSSLSANRASPLSTTIIPPSHHHKPPLNPNNSSVISGEGRGEDSRDISSPGNVTADTPTTIPATSGHHLRRHNDQKNHHDLLYPKISTVTPFSILENPLSLCIVFLLHA